MRGQRGETAACRHHRMCSESSKPALQKVFSKSLSTHERSLKNTLRRDLVLHESLCSPIVEDIGYLTSKQSWKLHKSSLICDRDFSLKPQALCYVRRAPTSFIRRVLADDSPVRLVTRSERRLRSHLLLAALSSQHHVRLCSHLDVARGDPPWCPLDQGFRPRLF